MQKALGIERTGRHAFRHAAASELRERERHLLSFSVNFGTETPAQRFRSTDTLWEIRSVERWNHSLRKSSVTL